MKTFKDYLAIYLAALPAAWLRYQAFLYFTSSSGFPWATLLVNLLGTAVLLFWVKSYLTSKKVGQRLLLALGVGFCGGLTTFSGFLLDILKLAEQGAYPNLFLYTFLTMGGGLGLVGLARKREKL